MTLNRYITLVALLLLAPSAVLAEQLFTAEFAPYEIREDAQSGVRKLKEYYRDFSPKPAISTDSTLIVRQLFMMPDNWTGRVVTLHIEGAGDAYDLIINERKVFSQEDAITPVTLNISKHLAQGLNRIDVALRKSRVPQIDAGVDIPRKHLFVGSYILAQPHLHIHDLDISIRPDSLNKRGKLNIAVALRNDFSQAQSVDVGYDIYTPSGELLDYSVNSFEVKGFATDTIRFSPTVIGAFDNKWSTDSPKLYRVMVYLRRRGVITEYIPRKVGFLDVSYKDNKIYNFSEPLSIEAHSYNAAATKEQSHRELLQLKKLGINTIAPSYPQPMWLYDLCNELGLWVVDQININAVASPKDKRVGGTPSNNPELLGEYMLRTKAAYSRSREKGCVIGYSLGGDESGNGYNMYRLYEWLKVKEPNKPIIYRGVRGEWNSDVIE
ncbi:MAG: glycoside hydrolase family 2 TIM barrel-domain containing protein [Rikenellaceae bacterium]